MPFFFSDPAIAPRTLWDCQPRDLPSCSIVAPPGWRNIDSSRASLLVLGFAVFLGAALAAEPLAFFFAIVNSIWVVSTGQLPALLQSLRRPRSSTRKTDHSIAKFAHNLPFDGCANSPRGFAFPSQRARLAAENERSGSRDQSRRPNPSTWVQTQRSSDR